MRRVWEASARSCHGAPMLSSSARHQRAGHTPPGMRFVSFSLLIGGGALLLHLYLYFRLVRPLFPAGRGRMAIAGVLVAMTVLLMARGSIPRDGGWLADLYPQVAYTWMAVVLCTFVAVLIGDLVRLGALVHRRLSKAPPAVDESRRHFIAHTVPRGIAIGSGVLSGYGIARAFDDAELNELAVRIPKLPSALDGISIVQLTDVHVGPFIRRRYLDRLVEQANALDPDIMVITGDLVDGSVAELGSAVAGLAALQARYGTYFVTGNHDYSSGDRQWCAFLESLGITVLRNRRVSIGDAGGSFDLVGVDDWSGARRRRGTGYDLDAAMLGRDPQRAAVLLAHQPTNFAAAAAAGVDLQISGHTHGGQIFPMTALVGLAYPYSRGLYQAGASQIFVGRGCGFWGPPARLGSPREIVKLVLTT
jgi:uncharacterized protein